HAADVCAADHPVRDRNRRQHADRSPRRSPRHQAILTAPLFALEVTTMVVVVSAKPQPLAPNLPLHRDPYYGGRWQKPKSPRYVDTISPGTGEPLGKVVDGSAADAEAAIAAAKAAFPEGRRVPPLQRENRPRRVPPATPS